MQRIPGIRVHEDAATRDGYVVLLDGAAVAHGQVRVGQRYCAAGPAVVRDLGLKEPVEEVVDPVTHATAVWCPESSWEALTSRGLTLLSETQFILRHVEALLRAHLDLFLGVQEAEDWIARASADTQIPDAARATLDDPVSRLLFARALRTLASEGVALTEPAAILEGAQAAGWSGVAAIVDQVRLRVKSQLPGNETGTVLLNVPDGRLGLADGVAPEVAHQMLLTVREWLRPRTTATGLVTHDAAARRVLRRLIEVEFPSVPVLAADEVVDPERLVAVSLAESGVSQGLS
jgi:flagellar biosynthesis component FlhA